MKIILIILAISCMISACGKEIEHDVVYSALDPQGEGSVPLAEYSGPDAQNIRAAYEVVQAMGVKLTPVYIRTENQLIPDNGKGFIRGYCVRDSAEKQLVLQPHAPNDELNQEAVSRWVYTLVYEYAHCSMGLNHSQSGLMSPVVDFWRGFTGIALDTVEFDKQHSLKMNLAPMVDLWKKQKDGISISTMDQRERSELKSILGDEHLSE